MIACDLVYIYMYTSVYVSVQLGDDRGYCSINQSTQIDVFVG